MDDGLQKSASTVSAVLTVNSLGQSPQQSEH
jgi:hypothetical protein